MPFTPYHIGPSGFIGLLLRRWLDGPVFLLVNVLIDIEVLADNHFAPGWPVHQLWHFHTLLVGGLAGAAMGAAFYFIKPLRRMCELGMAVLGLPYRAKPGPMVAGGLLGAWLHVLIDSFYHYDVQIFWPYERNTVQHWMLSQFRYISALQQAVITACVILWGLLIALYLFLIFKKIIRTAGTKA